MVNRPGVGLGKTPWEIKPLWKSKGRRISTISGLPLSFEFEWPFHKSASGADFWVLHGTAYLEDGTGLRADFSIHLSQTMSDMLPNTEMSAALPYVINVVRRRSTQRTSNS